MVVYLIRNLINRKVYVGKTTKSLEYRWRTHREAAKYADYNYPLHSAIRKYGPENFSAEVLVDDIENEDLLNFVETFSILLFESNNREIGYNLTTGGEGQCGLRHSAETKEKISLATRGKKKSPETVARMTVSRRRWSRVSNHVGKRFGRWVIIEGYVIKGGYVARLCRCDCGTEKYVLQGTLNNGASKSCGCLQKELAAKKAKERFLLRLAAGTSKPHLFPSSFQPSISAVI